MSYSFEELSVGLSASIEKTVSEQDVQTFAQVTGDTNPVHLDADYAATTSFEKPIAHGMLTAGFISAAIGTKLPGPGCIYLEQSLKFRAPVFIGATVTTTVTVKELNERRRRAIIETTCLVNGKKVVTGEATIMIP
ncbi:MaoC family dehydratase [Marinomonas atlantica]|uniref:MaoC family dehydratase n=1 Tax=Marinomonas atlantica TaxID=1806668 RepID=UPI0009EDCED6|nr:MaoC family dehydratase [Marinomonas atlantica]MCO4785764.1 MaoC family dehydratase [Marinomonas atlantica]